MESSKQDDAAFLDRGSRRTRGKRMTKLLDEELEEDELFWNQDALKEAENDDVYEEEADIVDEFDSDFDEDEPEPEEEVEREPDDRMRTKKRLIFPGKSVKAKKKKNKVLVDIDKAPNDENTSEQSAEGVHQDVPDGVEGGRIVRKSTRTSVIVRQAEREAIQAALQATTKFFFLFPASKEEKGR